MYSARVGVTNDTEAALTVWVEPWGEDYTLDHGESLEVVASSPSAAPTLNLVQVAGGFQAYVEGARDAVFRVWQGERKLACGHKRSRAI